VGKIQSRLPVLMAQHDPPLTQQAVATAAGVSPTTIGALYHGRLQRLDSHLCVRLHAAFGWQPGDLWEVKDA